jgi:hypothetical protein
MVKICQRSGAVSKAAIAEEQGSVADLAVSPSSVFHTVALSSFNFVIRIR